MVWSEITCSEQECSNTAVSALLTPCAMSLAVGLFAVAGCALLATLLTDLLWAALLGLRAHLLPRLHVFAVDLKERYGCWAGQ